MATRWSELLDGIVEGTTSSQPPMVTTLRLPLISGWEPGRAWVDWHVDPEMFNERGVVFGGYLSTLIDSLAALAFITTLDESETFTTATLNVYYFRPVSQGLLRIEGLVVHRGRRMGNVDVTCTDDSSKVVARGSVTQVVIPLGSEKLQ